MFEPKDQKQLNEAMLEQMERAQRAAYTVRGVMWGLALAVVLALIIGISIYNSRPHGVTVELPAPQVVAH